MQVELWVTVISDIVCAIIAGVFGFIGGKTYYKKHTAKKSVKQKQKAGDNSNQSQIGGDSHVK